MCPTVFSVTNYFSTDILFLNTCPDLRAKRVWPVWLWDLDTVGWSDFKALAGYAMFSRSLASGEVWSCFPLNSHLGRTASWLLPTDWPPAGHPVLHLGVKGNFEASAGILVAQQWNQDTFRCLTDAFSWQNESFNLLISDCWTTDKFSAPCWDLWGNPGLDGKCWQQMLLADTGGWCWKSYPDRKSVV